MNANVHKAHPWHGIPMGENAPDLVTAFIEIVPTDTVKYEIDKQTGYLKIDRPQKYSNIVPALYGFIPKTYCADKIAELARERSGRDVTEGDGDALDIIVLCEKIISHGDITCQAKPIGGIRLIDGGEADDKIIAVLKGDEVYGAYSDISELPAGIVERLKHYFLTYKNLPGEKAHIEITNVYGREEAHEVIMTSVEDYKDSFY
ncbi:MULTISPECIES: inorganic pyrophosphatase [unclassified Dyadobacter]|uniref:inorganic pyrophosphatase n=1 Tax=unclassified Dyadobacter TaxID=2625061 RepID=UPI00135A7986|nr:MULTISPECIES: inorganic pyrophosphatase [unclassified Dyadobacter]MCF0054462.1 inorganic pyrophosphatase [Dyadobacter sp. CY356]